MQMLGCGANVRIIALPHVRCACGMGFGNVRVMCVRTAVFERAMCDRTFALIFQVNDNISCFMTYFFWFRTSFFCFRTTFYCFRTSFSCFGAFFPGDLAVSKRVLIKEKMNGFKDS